MIIGSIKDGIVIDHIPAGRAMELYKYLNLEHADCEVAIIKNAQSKKLGRKDVLKINEILDINYELLGYIAPDITVNIIRDGQKAQKLHPGLPETITDMIKCKNPRCITTTEQELPQIFKLTDKENGVYRCLYCDTIAFR